MGRTVRIRKLRFLLRFLAIFAVLLVAWQAVGAARWVTRGLLLVAALIGPLLHGWVLETPAGRMPVWVHGADQVDLAVQFDALAIGVVPALALLAATPGLSAGRRVVLALAGAALCFTIDTVMLIVFPLLVFHKNPLTDVIGTFVGLVAFVGAPVIVWFMLLFREVQGWLPGLRR